MLLIEEIINEAIKNNASDLHLAYDIKPVIRVDGNLKILEQMPEIKDDELWEFYDYVIQGDIEKDSLFKQNKSLDSLLNFDESNIRINISLSEEKPIFTLHFMQNKLPKFEELNIPEIVKKSITKTEGLVLVTGKMDSNKSTTINVLVDEINQKQSKKILVLEKIIEYQHINKKSFIVQKEVGSGKDVLTFEDGIKNSIKEDCDVLVIGEITDRKTMEAALEFAETGKLVIGTLYTNSCAGTIDRILEFFDAREKNEIKNLLANILKLVIAQRKVKGKIEGESYIACEVMNVDNSIASCIKKEKFNYSEIEDAIHNNHQKGSVSLVLSLANLYLNDKITLDAAKAQTDSRNLENLNRTISQLKNK